MASKTSKTKAASKATGTKAAKVTRAKAAKGQTSDTARAPHEPSEPGDATNPGSSNENDAQVARAKALQAAKEDHSVQNYNTAKSREMRTADQRVAEAHEAALNKAAKNNNTTVAEMRAAPAKRAKEEDQRGTAEISASPLKADLPQETAIPSELALRAALREGKLNDLSAAFLPRDINPPHTTDMVAAIGTGPFGDSGPSGAGEAGIGLPARRGSATQ